jgi:DNA polymerase II small subunit/DNA polymerase delta subunit B
MRPDVITVMLGRDAKGGNDSILNDEMVGIIGKPARRGGTWDKGRFSGSR